MGTKATPIYLEQGAKRTLAGAMEWPGWCRSGRDDDAAIQALRDAGPRYAAVLRRAGLDAPDLDAELTVVERLTGNASTDYGVPDQAPPGDERPIGDAELERLRAILRAAWDALAEASRAAEGVELRKGPRGGGRDLEKIVGHVLEAEQSYMRRIGGAAPKTASDIAAMRDAALDSLGVAARDGVPPPGPRGGARWLPRYYARRSAWHILDHVWEIEDRSA